MGQRYSVSPRRSERTAAWAQRLAPGEFVADHADRLVLLVLRIHGQWITGGVAAESVTQKIHAYLTRRVGIEDLLFEGGLVLLKSPEISAAVGTYDNAWSGLP